VLRLGRYLESYKKECILGPLFKLLEAIFELLLPTIMALMINNGVNRHDGAYVLKAGGLMAGMAACGFLSALVCQYFASRASQGFGTVLRNDLFARISALSISQLDGFGTQSLTNRITNDVNTLQVGVAMLIRLVIRAPFICIGAIIMAMMLNLSLSLVLIASMPVFVAIIWFIARKSSPLYRAYQRKLDSIAIIVRENLSGIRVIRAFAKAEGEKRRFDTANDELTDTALVVGRVSALLNPATTLVVNAGILAILWAGSKMVGQGSLMQGQIIAFVNYIMQLLLALIVVSNLVVVFSKASASAGRVSEILETVPDMPPVTSLSGKARAEAPAIEFEGLGFGYGGGTALHGITLRIERGETAGVIGGTGSGKSTLVHLVARFYDATEGEIRIDGVPIRDIPDRELRAKVGIAPQRAVLFTGTIAENLRLGAAGKSDISDAELVAAARIAQADEFIAKLPAGYRTPVERGGANFSGGQRQRLGVARAIVGKPEILLLDDASSALDYSTDAAMRRSLRMARAGQTTVIVSQRAAAIRDADRIIVLDKGLVVGIGSHEELMNDCRTYRDIIASQA
jgi:ATP-binding cassette subfamily B protein